MDRNPSRNRLTIQEAAARLGVTEQAVRKRVKRGTIPHEREPDNRLYVYLDEVADKERDEVPNPYADALISQMEARITSLEHQLEEANTRDREARRLLAAALERMPQIEPAEQREPSETAGRTDADTESGVTSRPDDAEDSRSAREPESKVGRWLRRTFRGR